MAPYDIKKFRPKVSQKGVLKQRTTPMVNKIKFLKLIHVFSDYVDINTPVPPHKLL